MMWGTTAERSKNLTIYGQLTHFMRGFLQHQIQLEYTSFRLRLAQGMKSACHDRHSHSEKAVATNRSKQFAKFPAFRFENPCVDVP